ncbi:MAG TPA: hypothetical protein VD735_06325 [Candidatus Saccharimonadales bacterium]|nr:hypothetical protein [Candidatus Saccharimonadales bacterium]
MLVVLVLGISTVGSYSTQKVVYGAPTPTLNQTITAGTLSTDILNASRVPVASPSAAFSAKPFSFDCQSGGSASTASLGSDSEREYVINPGGANNGWVLSIAATTGPTAVWTNGTATYDFNDGGTSGCSDTVSGNDPDDRAGQLTVNPTASVLTTDCLSCTATNITKGSSTSFTQVTTNSATLLNAAAASDDNWRGYLTGTALSQTIPAEQAAGAYTLGMTITVVAS